MLVTSPSQFYGVHFEVLGRSKGSERRKELVLGICEGR